MLMPSRWARRISPYWNTVSILCLRFQDCPGDGPYWNGDGRGGSRLDADFRLGGGSLLDADYHPSICRKCRSPFGRGIAMSVDLLATETLLEQLNHRGPLVTKV